MSTLFGEAPPGRPVNWHAPSGDRASITILWTCMTTLLLCIWTAIHLNLPEEQLNRSRSKWNPRGWLSPQQWRKIGWLLLGLLAPEMVVFTAWVQRRQAIQLTNELREIWKSQEKSSSAATQAERASRPRTSEQEGLLGRTHIATTTSAELDLELGTYPVRNESPPASVERESIPQSPQMDRENLEPTMDSSRNSSPTAPSFHKTPTWTNTHSFLALSGGFAFDTSDLPEDEKFLPGFRNRVVLNCDALKKVAECYPSLIPDIQESTIKDKSKADALAKTIVCIQATWFIVQTIVRLSQHVSVSLLELNTAAHSLCALLIYWLWWDKPLDVEEPILIQGKEMQGICAHFCFYSAFDDTSDVLRLKIAREGGWEKNLASVRCLGFFRRYRLRVRIPKPPRQEPRVFTIDKQRYHVDFYFPADARRWELQSSFGARRKFYGTLADRLRNFPTDFGLEYLFNRVHYTRMRLDWPFGLPDQEAATILFAFTCAGVGYGGLHLIAWKYPFTTHTHEVLWRLSGLTVTVSGPLLIAFILSYNLLAIASDAISLHFGWADHRFDWVDYRFGLLMGYTKQRTCLHSVLYGSIWLIVFFSGLLYLFARTFIVVECFISFAYLPDSVFQQPHWTYYIPHIS